GSDGFSPLRWRLPDGVPQPPLAGHDGSIWSVDVSPDGALAATASSDGTIRLWDTTTWRSWALRGPEGRVLQVAFTPDSKQLLSGHDGGTLLVWDVATRKVIR